MSTQPTTDLLENAAEIIDFIEVNYLGVKYMTRLRDRIENSIAENDYESLQADVNNGNAIIAQNMVEAYDMLPKGSPDRSGL
jgi:hypothetical protein